MHKILIIGGTSESNKLADSLSDSFITILSLQGNTEKPRLGNYLSRIGGFGGVEGLRDYLSNERIDAVVDASHPYSKQISNNVLAATKDLNIKLYQLHRPAWKKTPSDSWFEASSFIEASFITNSLPRNSRIFLTIGKKNLEIFEKSHKWMMVRTIDKYQKFISKGKKYIVGRGPFRIASELINMRNNKITHLVTRNSGSAETYAKIYACRVLNIPIIMIGRENDDTARKSSSIETIKTNLLVHFGLNK